MNYYTIKAVNAQGLPYTCCVLSQELAEAALGALEEANYTNVSYDHGLALHAMADTLANDILDFSSYEGNY